MKILFLQTGGTIDKDYIGKVKSYAFSIDKPAVKNILANIDVNFDYDVKTILRKDSMDITYKDRTIIKDAVISAKEKFIIITHGTDTMTETAKFLSGIEDKVVVLTGALIPEKFKNSDAAFNIGTAIGGIGLLSNGIYIAMSGRIYSWNNVIKDPNTGIFVYEIK